VTCAGTVVDGVHAPSSDTLAHAYVYRHMPKVGDVVHTHSAYATAWAARQEPIPRVLIAIADEFGREIPVWASLALIGAEEIGRGIVQTLTAHRSPAVLMANHGVFAVGPTAEARAQDVPCIWPGCSASRCRCRKTRSMRCIIVTRITTASPKGLRAWFGQRASCLDSRSSPRYVADRPPISLVRPRMILP